VPELTLGNGVHLHWREAGPGLTLLLVEHHMELVMSVSDRSPRWSGTCVDVRRKTGQTASSKPVAARLSLAPAAHLARGSFWEEGERGRT
jgi:hypothetical protein